MGIDMEGMAVATAGMGAMDTCMKAAMDRVAKAQEQGWRSLTCLHLASSKNGYASLIGFLEGLIKTFAHLSRSGSAGSNDQGKYHTKSNGGGGGGVLVDGQGPRNHYDCRGDGYGGGGGGDCRSGLEGLPGVVLIAVN